jgi:hypothetical protein
LLALEAEISQAWEHLASVCDILAVAESRMAAWQKANPKPTIREHRPYSQNKADDAIRRAQERAQGNPSDDFIFATIANADYKAAHAEHEVAMGDWRARHEAAEEETGLNRAHELEGLAHERLRAAINAMASTRAATIEGICAKARASAKIEEWASADPELALSIVEDLNGKAG